MFDMQSIGIKISQMRKDAGLTQMGLADKLNISFQAVSSWERGLTMPDILKLHELADIFGVTIDDILGGRRESDIVLAAEANETPAPLPTLAEVSEVAPILTAAQTDTLTEKIIKEKGDAMNLQEIASVAPFLSTEFLDELAEKIFSETGSLSALGPIVPFVSSTYVDRIACKAIDETGDLSAISPILPFVSSEVLDKYAVQLVAQADSLDVLRPVAPFVSSTCINNLAEKALAEKGLAALSSIIPFIDSKIIEAYIKEKYLH